MGDSPMMRYEELKGNLKESSCSVGYRTQRQFQIDGFSTMLIFGSLIGAILLTFGADVELCSEA